MTIGLSSTHLSCDFTYPRVYAVMIAEATMWVCVFQAWNTLALFARESRLAVQGYRNKRRQSGCQNALKEAEAAARDGKAGHREPCFPSPILATWNDYMHHVLPIARPSVIASMVFSSVTVHSICSVLVPSHMVYTTMTCTISYLCCCNANP